MPCAGKICLIVYSHCDYHCNWMMGHEECMNECFADDDIFGIIDRLVNFKE